MASPAMTPGAPGNVRSSASLAASATANYNLDYSAKLEGQVTVKNTPGGTIAGTAGVRVDFFARYGTGPATTTLAYLTDTLPSAVASTAESKTYFLPTGKWNVAVTNLDASNAVTVEITGDTVDGVS